MQHCFVIHRKSLWLLASHLQFQLLDRLQEVSTVKSRIWVEYFQNRFPPVVNFEKVMEAWLVVSSSVSIEPCELVERDRLRQTPEVHRMSLDVVWKDQVLARLRQTRDGKSSNLNRLQLCFVGAW